MKPSWNRCLTRAVAGVIALFMLAIAAHADHNPEHTEAQLQALQSKDSTAGQDDDCPGAEKIRKQYADIPLGDGCKGGPRRMSLLGVQSDMGPDVRGTVRALADHHPLRIKLWCKENEVQQIYWEEAKAVKGHGLDWAGIVKSAQSDIPYDERELAASRRALSEEREHWARKEVIERLSAHIADLQAKLAKEQQTLAWAQKGLAEHEAKLKQAQAAQAAAYQAALAEAQKCQ